MQGGPTCEIQSETTSGRTQRHLPVFFGLSLPRGQMSNAARLWITLLGCCVFCLSLGGCGKAKQEDVNAPPGASAPTASAPKIYSMEDVDKELKEGQLVMGSSRENTRAFFESHANYQVCKDMESVTVAVVRNSKVDKHADDIYIVARYNRDGTIGAMGVGPPQFSASNLPSYCK
jgi:hypothetical protein